MKILPFGLRGLAVTSAIVLLVGIAGAGAASSDTSSLTNPKHFFWAQGQAPGRRRCERAPERPHLPRRQRRAGSDRRRAEALGLPRVVGARVEERLHNPGH